MLPIIASLCCLIASGKETPKSAWCDVIEINHVVRGEKVCLDQVIYWRFESDGKLHAIAWRSVPEDYLVQRVRGVWIDRTDERRVYARSFRERWTDYDPEMMDRSEWPVERRKW